VASFLYDADAPLAERRAQALAVDQTQLRELIGDVELRELLDAGSIDAVERELQRLDPRYQAKSADAVHDMLLAIGDLTADEIRDRTISATVAESIDDLVASGRAIRLPVGGEARYIAVEDAARYRDALGVSLPDGVPRSLLAPPEDPLGNLARRYARTHAPFTPTAFAERYGLSVPIAEAALVKLTADGRLVEGEFRPGGIGREWTDGTVLGRVRQRSLAKLRHETEPVDQAVLGRLTTTWQGIVKRRQGADALLDAIEQLQGAPLPASILETEILPSRIDAYDPADLDAVTAAGEVVWVGVEPIGDRDGRVALYLADQTSRLLPPDIATPDGDAREAAILKHLQAHGASFFGPLHEAIGGGYPDETVAALWHLAWRGLITNDTFHALRAFTQRRAPRRRGQRVDAFRASAFRSRRSAPPSAEGRWALVTTARQSATQWATAWAQQLLARHGVLTREAVSSEGVAGGFSVVYPVLKALEESGRIRRGYFVAGLGATQFALPGSLDLLRSLRDSNDRGEPEVVVMAATDPANPYGASIKFPALAAQAAQAGEPAANAGRGATRSVGATVILVDGALAAYLARGDRQLLTWLPEAEPQLSNTARAVAEVLITRARSGGDSPRGMLIEEIDGLPPATCAIAASLLAAGFIGGALGFQATFPRNM
jgi:ATP-dependent Lhr-like helicase